MQRPKSRLLNKRKIVCSECKTNRPHSSVHLGNSRKRLPGNAIPISMTDTECFQKAYQSVILRWDQSEFMWLACSDGKFNSRAVEGGRTSSGEHMYIARAKSPGWNKCVGYFIPSKGACFILWKGTFIRCNEYELLCRKDRQSKPSYTNSVFAPLGDSLKVLSLKNPWKPFSYLS